jgi:hypothetical protein
MKSLTNSKNPSSSGSLHVPAFQKPPVTLKAVPKATVCPKNCSVSLPWVALEKSKSTNERGGKPEWKFDAAFGTILRISKVFSKRPTDTFYSFFSSTRQAKNLKPFAFVQRVWI